MIFVTVGTQLPFERLIEAADVWAASHPDIELVAQVGETLYQPQAMKVVKSVTPNEYEKYLSDADIIIGHVGMGTIISGIKHGKPLVLMPRLADLGEHRNDHQLASARQFGSLAGITIVNDSESLGEALSELLTTNKVEQQSQNLCVSEGLVKRISEFVKGA